MEFNKTIPPSTNINLEKVEPLNQKRTLAFLNQWVVQTVGFLNQFSSVCESKLTDLDYKLQRTEDALAILEAKLSSIPGLDAVTIPKDPAANSQPTTNGNSTQVQDSQPSSNTSAAVVPSAGTPAASSTTGAAAAGEDAVVGDTVPVSDEGAQPEQAEHQPISKHPVYATFFRMVSVGVPEQAVKLKMASQGLDPALLDDPSAPAPEGEAVEEAPQPSDSEGELSSWSD